MVPPLERGFTQLIGYFHLVKNGACSLPRELLHTSARCFNPQELETTARHLNPVALCGNDHMQLCFVIFWIGRRSSSSWDTRLQDQGGETGGKEEKKKESRERISFSGIFKRELSPKSRRVWKKKWRLGIKSKAGFVLETWWLNRWTFCF